MKHIILFTVALFLYTSVSFGQSNKVSKKTIMPHLVEFLSEQAEIDSHHLADFKSGKREIELFGTINNYRNDELIDGVYTFFNSRSHHKTYLLLIENGEFKILNIATLDGVKKSMADLLNFCEREKYCVDITNEYMTKLLVIYNRINKNPQYREDINCKKGVKDSKDLP